MIIKNGAVFQEDGTFRKETLYIENHKLKASEEEITDKTATELTATISPTAIRKG